MNEFHIATVDNRYKRMFNASLVCLALLASLCIALFIILCISHAFATPPSNLCVTPACIKASNRILENLDTTVDPCDDFHQFSCGSFIKKERIPEDKSKYDVFDILKNKLATYVSESLNSPENENDIEATIKAKNLYKSCINEELVNSEGEANFIKIVDEYFGGWPILGTSPASKDMTLIEKLVLLRKYGFKPLIDIRVSPNPKNPQTSILKLKQPSWFFNQVYYTDIKFEQAYKKYLLKFVTSLNPMLGDISAQVDRIYELEKELASQQIESNRRTAGFGNITIDRLSAEIPNFDWRAMIIEGVFKDITDMEIGGDEPIIVYDVSFVKYVCDFLASDRFNREDVDNLIVWAAIRKEVLFLPQKYKDANLEFEQVYRGAKSQEPREVICSYLTLGAMEYAVGRLYVIDNFDKNSKKATKDMIEMIRQEFLEILKENQWMDEKSRKLALDKANYIQSRVGYPEFIYNDTYLNSLYADFYINEPDYLRNSLHILKLKVREDLEKLRQVQDREAWITGPAIVNAFYSSYSNQICLPAGILQAPFYDAQYPNYLNYGGIGSVIGHEITHGFDEKGRMHDKNGVLYPDGNESLWTEQTIRNYNEKIGCIMDQYSSFKVEQINITLNGEKTLGENIADNGGLKKAFRAYQKWVEKNGEEPLLPGLAYNQNQLFFINNAQIWCSKYRDQYLRYQVVSANHSPGPFRINGPTSNSKEFAHVFQCRPNQRNNPSDKCSVW